MDWMQTLVIMIAVIVAVMLVVLIAIGLVIYRIVKQARSIAEHLDHTAANVERFSGKAAGIASGGVAGRIAAKAFEHWIKSKVNTGQNGQTKSRSRSRKKS